MLDNSVNTENKILEAAANEFMTKGYAGARTTTIAEAAGVTHGMLHYYFRTKEKLFNRIVTEKITLLKEALINPVIAEDLPLEEIIRNIVERHLDFINANPNLPRFLIGEVYSNSERAQAILRQIRKYAPEMLAILQLKIDSAAASGLCRETDAGMLMLDIASLNIFSFLAAPLVKATLGEFATDSDRFLDMRKKENFETIMRKLKP